VCVCNIYNIRTYTYKRATLFVRVFMSPRRILHTYNIIYNNNNNTYPGEFHGNTVAESKYED